MRMPVLQLQGVEIRYSFRIEHYNFSVQDEIMTQVPQGLYNKRITPRIIQCAPGIHPQLFLMYMGDDPVPIPLHFEEIIRVVDGRLGKGTKHG